MTARRRRLAPLLATTALLFPLAACSSGDTQAAPGAGEEVRIGLLAPTKGGQKAAGDEARRGAQLAADVINGPNASIPLPFAESSGLPNFGGAKIKIVPGDTSTEGGKEPQEAAAAAVTRLVSQENVSALVGAYDPEVTEFASQRSERYEVPFVNADSPATYLGDRGLNWFFRLGPSWRNAGAAFFSILQAQQKKTGSLPKIAVLHADDKAGRNVFATVSTLAEQGGYPKPDQVAFSPTSGDMTQTVQDLKAKNPKVVMVYATPGTVKPLIGAFAQAQYRPDAVLSFGLGYLTTEDYRGPTANVVAGLVRSVSWAPEAADRNPAARAVKELYLRKYTTPMTEAAAAAFTAVMTVAQAVDSTRSADPARIRTSLLSLDIPGEQTIMPWGGVQFDETHQNVRAQVLVEQFLGQEFKVVWPRDAAASGRELVYPAEKALTSSP